MTSSDHGFAVTVLLMITTFLPPWKAVRAAVAVDDPDSVAMAPAFCRRADLTFTLHVRPRERCGAGLWANAGAVNATAATAAARANFHFHSSWVTGAQGASPINAQGAVRSEKRRKYLIF